MTELYVSDFMPQWQYDHSQDRECIEDEAAMQWRGMNRVAEQVRRREEHDLEGNFDAMDFEARAAALEAHFFGVRRRSPPPERDVPRVRPQSASLARRIANSAMPSAANVNVRRRQRPQSAKNRSDTPKASECVDWNTPIELKASKWREMLVRGPEFKQLTLRQLEIETYELLYSTLERTNVQPSARRRKRKKKASDVAKSNSKELACGSGLHLARSRKKRQQEHDRELMLGKTRQPSRRSERERAKAKAEGKQSIQDKTRRRDKQLQTKTSRTQLQERQPAQVSTRDRRTEEMCVQRPSSANRVRGPWVPSGSARSAAIRGISPVTEVAQDKRIEQMLEEVFQRQIHAHMSKSKNVQNQLKKAQQRVESCRTSKVMSKSARPASAPRIATSCTDEVGVPIQPPKGNQENDRIRGDSFRQSTSFAPVLVDLQLSSREIEALISESPATPKLMIPPLRFPPNLWKYQLTDDSQHGISESPQLNSFHLPSNSPGAGDDTSQLESTCDDKIEGESAPSCDVTNVEHVDEIDTQVEVPAHDQGRRATVEDLYLAEGHDEQTSSGFSSGGNETLPSELEPEHQTRREVIDEQDKCMNIELLDHDMPTPKSVEDAQISLSLGEERSHTEILTSSVRPTDSPSEVAADTAKVSSVENEISAETSYLSSRAQDSVVTLVESTNIDLMAVDHNIYEDHCSSIAMKESIADRGGDDIDADVIMGEVLDEFENMSLVGRYNTTGYEQHGYACQELKTSCDVPTLDPIVAEFCSVIPIPDLESNYSSPDNPESITSAVKSDTPLEMQLPISQGGDLDVDQNNFTTVEDSGLPLTFTIETGALKSNSESNENSESCEVGGSETVRTIDCDNSIGTLQLGIIDQFRTSASDDEQQLEEPEDVESSQQKSSEYVDIDNNVPEPESIFEQSHTLPETTALIPVRHEDKVEEDPLRLHQQEVTRSFLKRISSRTCIVVDQELSTSQPEPRKEQDEDDDTLGSTEPHGGVMGIEFQIEQNVQVVKEHEFVHGYVIECETAQALEDHESTIETYPPATVSLATTSPTEKVDKVSADGDSTVTNIEDIAFSRMNIEAPLERELDSNNASNCDKDTLSHLASSEVNAQDRTLPSVELHNAARSIQAQYRCFVRRRLILDQLHFVVANQRRQARKKSRQKEHRTKAVDMATPIQVPEANNMDSLPEEVQPVVLTARSDKGVEVTPELPLMEEPRPSVEDAGRKSRKVSYEYSFDLFDGLSKASGEVKLDISVRAAEDSNGTRPERLEQQQEYSSILCDQDVGTSVDLLQEEETSVLLVVPSDTIEAKPNLEELTASASSFPSSTTQAELAVIDNVEEIPAQKSIKSAHVEAVSEIAEVDSRWERYVDSTTSKSYYFNPNTNETQWTAPAGEDRSHSTIISSRATPTTPHSAAGTAPYAGVSLTRQSELWQEFLDEASGQLYYYNTKTGECSWEPPATLAASDSPAVVTSLQSSATAESEAIGASSWIMYIDPASQAPYYVNVETLATSWEKPEDFIVAEPNGNGETYVITVDDHAALEI
ncbi:hypothetical protein DVH05_007829 [Phytophthora capsici]|nr:hypothetical protein DVH05_007829 [Phytophthora capsici]